MISDNRFYKVNAIAKYDYPFTSGITKSRYFYCVFTWIF